MLRRPDPAGSLNGVLLDQLVSHLAVQVEPFAMCEVGGAAALELDEDEEVTLHFVLAGSGRLELRNGSSVPLGRHTLVIVPAGMRQSVISDAGDAEAPGCRIHVDGLEHHVVGEESERTLLMACGHIRAVYGAGIDLFGMLRESLVVDFSGSGHMHSAFDRLLAESSAGSRPGTRAMLGALMNECLVELMRVLCAGPECDLPWLRALENPHLAAALAAVFDDPGGAHSLESLARAAMMSRSAFAAEFQAGLGQTPMAFVRNVRMSRAAQLLQTTSMSVEAVGTRVGFASRSHFSRAFQSYFGVSPSGFRGATVLAAG